VVRARRAPAGGPTAAPWRNSQARYRHALQPRTTDTHYRHALQTRTTDTHYRHALQTHTTDTFLFISHKTNALLFSFLCNIFNAGFGNEWDTLYYLLTDLLTWNLKVHHRILLSPVTSSLLGPNTLLSTLFSNTLSLRPSLSVSDQVSHPYRTTGNIIVLYILIFNFLDSKLEDVFVLTPDEKEL
jgi:hypothetical protein